MADVKDVQLHAIFIYAPRSTPGADFIKLGDREHFLWYHSYKEAWQDGEFKEHAPVFMHNNTRSTVPTTWLILGTQSTVYLIANSEILVNIQTVHDKDMIRVQCNSGKKVVNQVGEFPGYGTV